MNNNAALAAYVASAKSLDEAARKFQSELVARQERQQSRLVDFQKQMVARLEKRRREVLDSDPDLKDLTHLLDLKTRERSAADASGLKRDSARLGDEIKYINDRIDARRRVLLEDPFYSEAITGLQAIVNASREQLNTDRADSEKSLKAVEEAFAAASPLVEKLPESQRELAAQIADNASAMAKARNDFATASAATDPETSDVLKKASADNDATRQAVAARRAELSNEARKRSAASQGQLITSKEAELAEAARIESAARDAFQAKRQELDRLASRERSYQDAKEELERIARSDEPAKRQQVAKLTSELSNAERLAEAAVRPAPPAPAAVTRVDDPRGLYTAGAFGALATLFGLVLVLNGVNRSPRL
jgi:hypothetical protein